MKSNNLKKIILVVLTFISVAGYAQIDKFKYYHEKFPKEGSVVLEQKERFVIDINKTGELEINRLYQEDILLIGKFSGGWNEDVIYFSSFEEIHDLKAATLIPSGNSYKTKKIKEFKTEKLMSENVFQDDVSAIFFEFPEVSPGCRKTQSYTERILQPLFLPPLYFQNSRFTEKMVIELDLDQAVNINILEFNLDSADYSHTITTEKKGRTLHTWTLKDIEAFESESMAPSPSYYVPHISFTIADYTFNGKTKNVLSGVEDLRAFYIGLLDSVNPSISAEMQTVVDSISNNSSNDLVKAQEYYNWVRKNIRYIAVEDGLAGFIPDNPAKVTSKKYGDCKGMSCLLSNIMRADDLNIYETWIGTRSKPYTYHELYTPYVDNHMISAYKHNNEWIFLDATDRHVPFGYPSKFIQGKEAMINAPGEKATLVTVPIIAPENNYTHTVDTLSLKGNHLHGKSVTNYGGYRASYFKARHYNATNPDKLYAYLFEKGNNKFSIENEVDVNIKDSVVDINYSYKVLDYVRNLDDKIYVNLNLNSPMANEALDKERKYPIEMDEQQLWTIVEVLPIPDGKVVSYYPEDYFYKDEFFEVAIGYTVSEKYIIYKYSITNTGLILPASYVKNWNDLGKKLRKQYRQTIELSNK